MTKIQKKSRKKENGSGFKNLARLFVAVGAFAALFITLSLAVTPVRYDISVGQPAPNTIKATKDVNDMITTERLKTEAASTVNSIYKVDETADEAALEALDEVFIEFKSISALLGEEGADLSETQLAGANERLETFELDMECLKALAGCNEEALALLHADTAEALSGIMNGKLSEDKLEESVSTVKQILIDKGYSEGLSELGLRAARACAKPNYYYDEEATEAARQAERDKIATVSRVKGEVIVSDGELVTEAQYAMLDALGMVKESTMDVWLYAGIGLLLLALITAVGVYLYLFEKKTFMYPKKLLMIALICVLTMLACVAAKSVNIYIMPVTLGLLLISLLINRRVAVYINIPLSILASLLASASGSFFNMSTFTVVISSLVSGVAALAVTKKKQSRIAVMLSGAVMGAASIISTFAVGLISSSSVADSLFCALYSGIGGIISALLCLALTPVFEVLFNAVTTTRLIELSNPNQPLLRRLLLEAPGTYHHSIIVANLAEAAAMEVGANGLLARVGAYYHDIGKLMRPGYFTENQLGDNPHDRTDPRVSTAIITAHPREGVQLLTQNRAPEEIKNIVLTHHGDTPVVYFYNKSVTENGEADVNDFRYPGPKPSTKEEAIVMLADTVEAASRAMASQSKEKLGQLIDKLVKGKIEDGQLDECDISFNDITLIKQAFLTVLGGAFHERIEYPKVEITKEK